MFERRLAPTDSPLVVLTTTAGSIVLAFVIGAVLFLPFVSNPSPPTSRCLTRAWAACAGWASR